MLQFVVSPAGCYGGGQEMEASSCSRTAKQGRSSGFCRGPSKREYFGENDAVTHVNTMTSPPSSTTPWAGRRCPGPSAASGAAGLCSGPPTPRCWCGCHKGGGPRCTPPTWAHLRGSEGSLERCKGRLLWWSNVPSRTCADMRGNKKQYIVLNILLKILCLSNDQYWHRCVATPKWTTATNNLFLPGESSNFTCHG